MSYDLAAHPFPALVADILGVGDLEQLHRDREGREDPAHDQDSDDHSRFYENFARVRPTYDDFLVGEILPLYDADLAVQRVPTFRVHRPGGLAVSEFHRDSEYNHQPATRNYWLPLTRAFSTNSIWIECVPDTGDYAPATLGPGEMLRFDAVSNRHGNHANDTGVTRVSFDFRVIPLAEFQDSGRTTVNARRPMSLDGYFRRLDRDGSFAT